MEQTTRALYCNPIWSRIFPFLRWWPLVTRDTLKADLIAGLQRALLGSVSERVIDAASTPVLVAKIS